MQNYTSMESLDIYHPYIHVLLVVLENDYNQYKAVQRTAISPTVVFLEHLVFSQPVWYVEPNQNCTLPLVKNGKIGNTSCLIGNLNILGYMHIVSIKTTVVPS